MRVRRRPTRYLLAGVVVSTVLKLWLWSSVVIRDENALLRYDSASYIEPAKALLRHGVFAISAERPDVPETIRTPGYSLFLVASFALFGERLSHAVLVQILIAASVAIVLYTLVWREWGVNVAALAAGLSLLDFSSFAHSLLVLSEMLFTLLLVVVALASLAALRAQEPRRTLAWCSATGLLLGAATHTRPVSYYLAVPIAIGLSITMLARGRPRFVALGGPALLVLSYTAVIAGWELRNRRLTGSPEFSSIVGINMLHYRAAGVVALRDGVTLAEAQRRLAPEGSPETARENPQFRLGDRWLRRGLAVVREEPLLFARVWAASAVRMMAGPGVRDLLLLLGDTGQPPHTSDATAGVSVRELGRRIRVSGLAAALTAGSLLHLVVVYIGAAVWALLALRRRIAVRAPEMLLSGVLLYLVVTQAGPEAYARMRVPMMPFLSVLAAIGYTCWPRGVRRTNR